ncbi:MAG: hypothetical protein AAGN82_13330, partial [Myxococcota bacterium]
APAARAAVPAALAAWAVLAARAAAPAAPVAWAVLAAWAAPVVPVAWLLVREVWAVWAAAPDDGRRSRATVAMWARWPRASTPRRANA